MSLKKNNPSELYAVKTQYFGESLLDNNCTTVFRVNYAIIILYMNDKANLQLILHAVP